MGVGPNYVLDKGFVATGGVAYNQFDLVVSAGTGTSMARATSAGAKVLGVCQEAVDVAKVSTGKVVANVRLLGISRAKSGGVVNVMDRLTNDATARAVTVNVAVGSKESFGVALTAATAADQYIDVFLTPFATVNTAVS